jgi:hypothetical protein
MAMSAEGDQVWGRRKRVLAWVHVSIQIAALLGLLVMANLLASKFPWRKDVTSRRTYGLSEMAEDLLRNLKYDVEIWVNPETYATTEDKALPTAYKLTQDMLEEFRRRTDHVKVYGLSGVNTPRMDAFQKHFGATVTPATLFLLVTLEGGRSNQKMIDISELYAGNALTGEIFSYKGEPILVQAISELGGSTKRFVYESEGHREVLTADVRRMGTLANFLHINEGVEFRRLPLSDYKTVPIDCDLLMIMAPEQMFIEHELEVLKEYIERGGSLLVAIRPKVRTGLEKFLEDYSIKVGDNVVCDPERYNPPSITNLQLVEFNNHPVNRNMSNVQFLMAQSCTIDPIQRKDNNWTITPIAMAGPLSWEEKGDTGPNAKMKRDPDEREGNMKVIVVVEKTAAHPMDPNHKIAKIDVWGSAIPFTNLTLKSPYEFQTVQGQYVVNHFRWLMARELLKIDSRKVVVKPLEISGEALRRLGIIVVGGFPAFGVALGILAWFMRRK